jgi:hypothetical protein
MQTDDRPGEPGTQDEVVRNTTQARQGVTGHNVRYVLGFGIVAVIIVFVIAYAATSGYFGA